MAQHWELCYQRNVQSNTGSQLISSGWFLASAISAISFAIVGHHCRLDFACVTHVAFRYDFYTGPMFIRVQIRRHLPHTNRQPTCCTLPSPWEVQWQPRLQILPCPALPWQPLAVLAFDLIYSSSLACTTVTVSSRSLPVARSISLQWNLAATVTSLLYWIPVACTTLNISWTPVAIFLSTGFQ